VAEVRPTVPNDVATTVSKSLAKAPADRYQSAEELAAALSALSTATSGATLPGIAPRWSHPLAVAGLSGVAAVGVLGLVYFLMMQLGLPDWVLVAAAVLLVVILPFTLGTGLVERRRLTRTVPTPSSGLGRVANRWLRWRKAALGSIVAFACLGVVTTSHMAMRLLGIGPAGTLLSTGVLEERERMVLADFEDRSGDSSRGDAVTLLVRTDLSQSPAIRLLQPLEMDAVLRRMELPRDTRINTDLALEVAEREGVKAVVTGEINVVGGAYVISAQAVVAGTGESLIPLRETARDSTGIIDAVDRLTKRLRERIGESLRSLRATPTLSRTTTASLPALRKYTQGRQAVRQGNRRRGVELLREAVAIDSMFATAYAFLALQLWNQGIERNAQVEAISAAMRLRYRLPERELYHLEQVYYTAFDHQPRKVIEVAQSHLGLDSSNKSTLSYLGFSYRQLREWEQALRYYRWAVTVDSVSAVENYLLIRTLLDMNRVDEAEVALARFEQVLPGHPSVARGGFNIAVALGDYATAEAGLHAVRTAHPENLNVRIGTASRLWSLAVLRGQLREAERWYEQVFELNEQIGLTTQCIQAVSRKTVMDILVRGNSADALVGLTSTLAQYPLRDIAPLDRPYTDLAVAYAVAGDTRAAREVLAEYESVVPAHLRRYDERNKRVALGLIALAEERSSDAVEEFKAADEGQCSICALPLIARAYDASGQTDSAIAFYERYMATPRYDINAADWINKPAAHMPAAHKRLGELQEERGNRDKAVEHYNEFVDLWQDADPALQPHVEDVRQRIARLMGEPQH
jgi:tetratricopeptide (TPR) repeat protein